MGSDIKIHEVQSSAMVLIDVNIDLLISVSRSQGYLPIAEVLIVSLFRSSEQYESVMLSSASRRRRTVPSQNVRKETMSLHDKGIESSDTE